MAQERIRFRIGYSVEFERALKRVKKNAELFHQLEAKISKVIRFPEFGKPLRYALKKRKTCLPSVAESEGGKFSEVRILSS